MPPKVEAAAEERGKFHNLLRKVRSAASSMGEIVTEFQGAPQLGDEANVIGEEIDRVESMVDELSGLLEIMKRQGLDVTSEEQETLKYGNMTEAYRTRMSRAKLAAARAKRVRDEEQEREQK